MAKPLSHWTLLTLLLAAPLLGCVAKPPEKPIVLRPPHSERRLVRRAPRPAAGQAPASPAAAPNTDAVSVGELPPPDSVPPDPAPAARSGRDRSLSAAEKEALFHDFDRYLARPERSPGRSP